MYWTWQHTLCTLRYCWWWWALSVASTVYG